MRKFSFLLIFLSALLVLSCSSSPKESFELGKKFSQDNKEKAKEFYLTACDGNIPEACFNLGELYRSGNDVSNENETARKFFSKSCDLSYEKGCLTIADMWQTGTGGVFQDRSTARDFYNAMCDKKMSTGCAALGEIYAKGEGTKTDVKKAAEYYDKACSYGDHEICRKLAVTWKKVIDTDEGYAKVVNYSTIACNNGAADMCWDLAETIIMKRTAPQVTDYEDYNEPDSSETVAETEFETIAEDVPATHPALSDETINKVEPFIIKACEGKISDACFKEATIKESKEGMSVAAEYYKKACNVGDGNAKGCYIYATFLIKDVEKDLTPLKEGSVYFDKACSKADDEACKQLYDLKEKILKIEQETRDEAKFIEEQKRLEAIEKEKAFENEQSIDEETPDMEETSEENEEIVEEPVEETTEAVFDEEDSFEKEEIVDEEDNTDEDDSFEENDDSSDSEIEEDFSEDESEDDAEEDLFGDEEDEF